jgi:uncharacterized protein YdbL (DUF1318 family)
MITRLLLFCAALFLLAAPLTAQAQSARELQARMAQRLPQIDELKAAGTLGENNRGYLEVREAKDNAAALAADENRDREAVYALIARETGSSVENVGRARAKQIAAQSRSGVWVQDESGVWRRK